VRSIARNQVRKAIRDGVRDARKRRLYGEFLAAKLQDDEALERERQRQQRLRDALAHCREKLSPAADRALDLRYRQMLGFAEIAATLERTVAATRQLLGRTRIALRRCVEQRMAQR
jgi:RNA polymerase sigma factor (sigma-70 family)